MSYMHPALAEHLRKRWERADAYRFAAPGTPEAKRPGTLHPWAAVARQEQMAADEARARAAAEQDALRADLEHLHRLVKDFRIDLALRRLRHKYSPDQPRVPAGNPDGGQWTSEGGSGAGDDSGDASQDSESLAQDQGPPPITARDQAPRSDLPQLEAIANDPLIRSRINEAWTASNPNSTRPQEHGFWISRNEATGELFTRPFANPGSGARIVPGPLPSDAIASFHTHPNRPDFGFTSGPSVGDDRLANEIGLPGLLKSHNGMYYFGPPLRAPRTR